MSVEPAAPLDPARRRLLRSEVLLVLGVSVGASALYAALSLLRRLLAPVPLSQSQATLNGSYVPDQPWLDLAFQLVGIGLGVVPALPICTLPPTKAASLSLRAAAMAL